MQERVERARDPGLEWVGLSQDPPVGMSSLRQRPFGASVPAPVWGEWSFMPGTRDLAPPSGQEPPSQPEVWAAQGLPFSWEKETPFQSLLAQSVSCPGLQMKETEVHRYTPSFLGWRPGALHLTTFCIYSLTFCMAPCRVDIKEMTFWRPLVS